MATNGLALLADNGEFPILPLLLLVISGIIGITAWLAWMFTKSQGRGSDERIHVAPPPAAMAETPPSESYLLGMRRSALGEWEIYVNDVRYRALEAVPGDAVRREVVAGMKELVTFARSYLQKEPSAASAAPAAPPAPATSRPEPAAGPPPVKSPASAPAPSSETTGSRPRLRLTNEPELKRTAAPPQFLTLDLAKDIGDIVEEIQQRTPALRDRSIRLRNAASGGIEFTIDGQVYASIDEIPDSDIQALIRAAIKEWERR